jgi:hypothetical protein
MRRAAKIDANQNEIVKETRRFGASVTITSQLGKGFPDVIVGWKGKNYLWEIKDGSKCPSQRKLTPDEEEWHEAWQGQKAIIESTEQAIQFLINH